MYQTGGCQGLRLAVSPERLVERIASFFSQSKKLSYTEQKVKVKQVKHFGQKHDTRPTIDGNPCHARAMDSVTGN